MDNNTEDVNMIIDEAREESTEAITAIQTHENLKHETFGKRCKADWKIVKA
jgi:hypothetical protein